MDKLIKAISKLHRGERGMTGLETAIILIAFVTVAAVFGYAVLSAGLFSAERGKEVIFAGVEQAKTNLEVSGSVIGYADNETQELTKLLVTVKNAVAGNPIDMTPNWGDTLGQNKTVISLKTQTEYLPNIAWNVTPVGAADSDYLLEVGEQFQIEIDLTNLDGNNNGLSTPLGPNDKFSIQVKPALGSTIIVQRTLPAELDDVMDLY